MLDGALRRAAQPVDDALARLAPAAEALLGRGGLTRERAAFDRRDALQAWCDQLPTGATVAQVESYADALLSDVAVVPLLAPEGERRYSTADMLAVEQQAVSDAVTRQLAGVAKMPADTATAHIGGRPQLNRGQAHMVRRLLTSGAGVDIVVGHAGSGKTFALSVAREAWEAAGHHVVGTALSAAAAGNLREEAGIPSASLARLMTAAELIDPDTGRRAGLGKGTVLVVDEAGMVGTRALAALLRLAAEDGAKVVLVGDHRQLPEIDAGGLFAALAHRLGGAELSQNVRQREEWEQQALADIRGGDVGTGLRAYDEHGRLRSADTGEQLREQMIDDWWEMRSARKEDGGRTEVLMLTSRRSDAHELNELARARLQREAELGHVELVVEAGDLGRRAFAVGDDVLVVKNTYERDVLNGTRGTVTAVDVEKTSVTVVTQANKYVVLDSRHLVEGRLDYGYAVTTHKAQGVTVDVALVLGTKAMSREAGYVGVSRGRAANYLYSLTADSDAECLPGDHGAEPGRSDRGQVVELTATLGRMTAKRLASEGPVVREEHRQHVQEMGLER